jgi:hypothetical protein
LEPLPVMVSFCAILARIATPIAAVELPDRSKRRGASAIEVAGIDDQLANASRAS